MLSCRITVGPFAPPMKNLFVTFAIVLLVAACSQKHESTATTSTGMPQFSVAARDITAASTEVVTGRVLSSPTQETAVVHIEFSKAKAEAFRKFTRDHLDKQVQVVVGTKVVAEPVIRSEIPGGKIEVHFSSPDEAQEFVASLIQE